MIEWMLKRLVADPAAVFYEQELVDHFSNQFQDAVSRSLVTRVASVPSFSYGLSRSRTVVVEDGRSVAYDNEDPEEEPLEISDAELRKWRLNLDKLVDLLREQNSLEGTPELLGDRIYFVGETKIGRGTSVVVFALVDDASALVVLGELPVHLPATKYHRVLAVCPAFEPPPSIRRKLALINISVMAFPSEANFSLPFEVDQDKDPTLGWPPIAVLFVRVLREAAANDEDVLGWPEIKGRLGERGYHPKRAPDVRRGVPNWAEVIESPSRGLFRLRR